MTLVCFWDERGERWLMAVSLPKERKVRFYASPNLKDWSQLSDFGPAGNVAGDWECPNLLKIPSVDGKQSIWALKVGTESGCAVRAVRQSNIFSASFDGEKVFDVNGSLVRMVGRTTAKTIIAQSATTDCLDGEKAGAARLDEQLAICCQSTDLSVARTDERGLVVSPS